MTSNEIKLGEGLGDLFFGMSRMDVRKILGDPDGIEVYKYTEESDEMAESWHFDKQEISLTFFEEDADCQLETIAVSSGKYKLLGTSFVGMSHDDVITTIQKLDLGDFEDEKVEGETAQKLIHLLDHNLFFWSDFDVIEEIQWEPLWNQD